MRGFISSLACAVLFATAQARRKHDDPKLTVTTTSGIFTASVDPAFPNVAHFLSVPYAQPPLGPLRFSAPQPLISESKTPISVASFGPSCPQYQTHLSTFFFGSQAPNFGITPNSTTGEDCLTLSIWTPSSPKENEKLPVIVFLPGGRWILGGSNVPYQIPASWVSRSQAHIVVTVNYRLNIFGFPNAKGLSATNSSLNLGLLDQHLALEWVQKNAAAFGGDPNRVTLWGQSAGAGSVDMLSFAFPEDGKKLYQGLIMDSGTAFLTAAAQDTAQSGFTLVAGELGCGNLTASAELDCMRKVDAKVIEEFLRGWNDNGSTPAVGFGPTIDSKVVLTAAEYTKRSKAGQYAAVPVLLGTNDNEAGSIFPYTGVQPAAATLARVTEGGFLCPAYNTATYRALKVPVHFYHYSASFPNISPIAWTAAYHCSELPLIFGTSNITSPPPQAISVSTTFETSLSERMQDLWLEFMKDPEELDGVGWPKYTGGANGSALIFAPGGRNSTVLNEVAPASTFVGGCGAVP